MISFAFQNGVVLFAYLLDDILIDLTVRRRKLHNHEHTAFSFIRSKVGDRDLALIETEDARLRSRRSKGQYR